MLWRLRILLCTRWCCDVRDALRLSGLHNTFSPAFFTHTRKKAHPSGWAFSLYLMPGSLWRASCPPPSGPLLRNVQIRSRRICPPQESAHRQTTDKTKGPVFRPGLSLFLMPGSSLLSHGETPHYHRRYGVSLLSSAWGQVGPPRYSRQANSVINPLFAG